MEATGKRKQPDLGQYLLFRWFDAAHGYTYDEGLVCGASLEYCLKS